MTDTEDELDRVSAQEQDARARTSRAAEATALLNNEMLTAAWDRVRTGLITNMTESDEDEVVLDARRILRALTLLKGAIEMHVRDGTLAQDEINKLTSRRSHLERYLPEPA